MYNHAPADYCCAFCLLGQSTPSSWTTLDDIVLKDEQVLAFVSPTSWPNNPGHVVVVIPIQHFENIYDLPVEMGGVLHAATRTVALAFKAAYVQPAQLLERSMSAVRTVEKRG